MSDDYMPEEYVYQGRIAISGARDAGQFNQNSMSGVLVSPKGQPEISELDDWECIQCEVIIRPIKRLGKAKIKNMRLDQAAGCLGDESQWEND